MIDCCSKGVLNGPSGEHVFFNLVSQQTLFWDLLIADLVSNDFISAVRRHRIMISMDLETLMTIRTGNFDLLETLYLDIAFVSLLGVQ